MFKDFIFELGCEELPSGSVWPLVEELSNLIAAGLDKAQLSYSEIKRFATPRRLAVIITELQTEQASQTVTRRGPAAISAFDKEGLPTPALSGFAKSCGVDIEQLSRIQTEKGEWMVYETQSLGSKTHQILPELVRHALASLTIAKPMRWGMGQEEFARPVHWAVMLYGTELIDTQIFGINTGRMSRGHRFHHPQAVVISSALTYESQMKEAYVIADFAHRRQLIKEQIQNLAASYNATVIMPDELVDEVTSIVEWPQALLAHFDKEFLEVPAEALIASMQSHQKTFALKDNQGNLLPYFITVANIASTNPEQVIQGNEKVMRARLSDAAFFFKQDKKQPLGDYAPATAQVVFQKQLGSLQEKTQRVEKLMTYLSQVMNFPEQLGVRAAFLSKCDLLSGMVGEFPELQGLMGYYYALNDGEDKEVADAIWEHYMPRFAADKLPDSSLGTALSLADRIDTLVGIFAIGQKPSGVKDPFKLRRHALAVVRLLVANPASLTLSTLITEAVKNYGSIVPLGTTLLPELKTFILERLHSYYTGQGINVDLILAVRARQDENLFDLDKRIQALKLFVNRPEAVTLTAACKRVNNLLAHAKMDTVPDINQHLLQEKTEHNLFDYINNVEELVKPLYTIADYEPLLNHLAQLKEPVDVFFDEVLVMVDDEQIKMNRIALLARLQNLLQGVADISMLQL